MVSKILGHNYRVDDYAYSADTNIMTAISVIIRNCRNSVGEKNIEILVCDVVIAVIIIVASSSSSNSSSVSSSEVGRSVVSGMPDIKIPQALSFHVSGQPHCAAVTYALRFTYNPFVSLPSVTFFHHPRASSLSEFPPLHRSPILHFAQNFPRRIFRRSCRKPSYPHFPSRYLLPTSSGVI